MDIKSIWNRVTNYWKQLFLGVLILTVFLSYGSCGGFQRWNEFKKWEKDSKTAVEWANKETKKATEAKKQSDSVGVVNDSLKKSLQITKLNANLLRRKNDSLSKLVFHRGKDGKISSNLPTVCDTVVELAVGLQHEVDSLRVGLTKAEAIQLNDSLRINKLTFAYNTEKSRGDSLTKVIINMPQPPGECSIARILPCPTRKQALIVGVVVGVVAVSQGKNILSLFKIKI